MRGEPLHGVLVPRAAFIGEGHVRGRLVALGGYPGLLTGPGRVRGELFRLADPELLPVIDREEGYNFVRCRATVTLLDGRRVQAWLYRYTGSQTMATPIPQGEWRRHRDS
jgi:gamma-glutamylcyclotransferase (GGCT)/AIG2-like uncharacterized protein YtfP